MNTFRNRSHNYAMLCALLVNALFFITSENASAHARMVRSSPAPGVVAQAPIKIDLWFNELLDGQFNTIAVYPASQLNTTQRVTLTQGEAKVDPKDRTHLTINLKPLEPGNYFVEWRVLSLDGHSAPGRYQIQVSKPQ